MRYELFKRIFHRIFHMARRSRRYYRRRRYRRRRYRRRAGRARAAATQRQTSRFVVKSMNAGVIQIASVGQTVGAQTAPNFAGTACISAFENLSSSNYFQTLIKMYDQFKLDSFKVKITPTQSILLQGQKQAVFVSAWDRNGITNYNSVPSFSEIASYGSAFQRTVNLDASSWTATRKIYASTIMERSQYVPTSVPGQNNVVNLGVDQHYSFPWNPQLLIGILCASTTLNASNQISNVTFQGNQTWTFMCEFTWTLTFRGLRYDAPTSAPMVAARVVNNTTAAVGGVQAYQNQPTITETQVPSDTIVPSVIQVPSSIGPVVPGTSYVFRDFFTRAVDSFHWKPTWYPSNYNLSGTITITSSSTSGYNQTWNHLASPDLGKVFFVHICVVVVPSNGQVSISISVTPNEAHEYVIADIVSWTGFPAYFRACRIGWIGGFATPTSYFGPSTLDPFYLLYTSIDKGNVAQNSINIPALETAPFPLTRRAVQNQVGITNVQFAYNNDNNTQTNFINIWPAIPN